MLAQIKKDIEKILLAAGVTGAIELTSPPNPALGDFAFPCFGLAKEWKMSPVEAAKTLASVIASGAKQSHGRSADSIIDTTSENRGIATSLAAPRNDTVERVEATGPYVNFYLDTAGVVGSVVSEVAKKKNKYGLDKSGKGKKILIEYPSNNTHKEFHIGHFRIVCIGNALVELYRALGYKVFPINYLNDFGAHVAKCLWGLQKFHANETPPLNKQKWLGEIYAGASNFIKEHPEAGEEVAEIQKKLEAHDSKIWPLFIKTRQWSIDKFEELFRELGVKHVAVFYEKDVKPAGQKIVDEILKEKIAEVGEGGAIIVNLEKYNLDVALVRKSNGVGLYLTSDLPLAREKFKKFKADESIVITGQEQSFYFKQLYKILELMGFKNKLTHLSCGLVNLPEGKMSSRSGRVVLYEDLRDEVYNKIYGETKERHADWPEKKITDVARKLSLAALKFDIQKHEVAKNIVFDIKEATALEGFGGPYILYVVARINSLIRKGKGEREKVKGDFKLLASPEEKKLALLMAEYEEIITKGLKDYNPSVITRYCFDLAQAFNEFYNKHSVLNAEDKKLASARLALCGAVKQVLENALGLLTIETVEEM